MKNKKIPVGIIGVSGYTGLELLKLLLHHPIFEVRYLANTQGEARIHEIHKGLLNVCDLPVQKACASDVIKHCDVVFLALPHKQSMNMAKDILALKPIKIIDLSADYRLSATNYEAIYGEHKDKENLTHAVYGLPEYNREKISKATLIANPGCYPTASLLALLPFAKHIKGEVFIDAKSGVSGAGKTLSTNTHFPHINENLFSYSPLTHRHQIEISQHCASFSSVNHSINFVPHLSPITRGMLVSVFATLKAPLSPKEANEILKKAYANEPFIRLMSQPVDMQGVIGSHFCDIFVATQNNAIFINASIDNLLRGASSQALLNANIACGIDEHLGIPTIPHGIF